jgi:hypothetical protein
MAKVIIMMMMLLMLLLLMMMIKGQLTFKLLQENLALLLL